MAGESFHHASTTTSDQINGGRSWFLAIGSLHTSCRHFELSRDLNSFNTVKFPLPRTPINFNIPTKEKNNFISSIEKERLRTLPASGQGDWPEQMKEGEMKPMDIE
jgi:hypothetical protein